MAKLYTREELNELNKLYNKAVKIQTSKKLSWEEKHDILYSDDFCGKILKELVFYKSGDYEEEVNDLMTAFDRFTDKQEEILDEIEEEEEEEK